MPWLPEFGRWDAVLVGAVTVQATVIAYLHSPKWKAFVFMLPIPFTCASMAVGVSLDGTHAAGLVLLLGFALAVRGLHVGLRVPIVPSIALSGVGYCLAGAAVRPLLPAGPAGFWWMAAAAAGASLVARLLMPYRDEPGHRTSLPIWVKIPVIAGVILALITVKSWLQGLMAVFPFVATVAAYESRHSLWTLCRQVPVLIWMLLSMMATVLLTQSHLGLGGGLAAGWVVYLVLLVPYWWWTLARGGGAEDADV